VRRKLVVTLSWLVLFLAGAAVSRRLPGHLSHDFPFPNTAADKTNHADRGHPPDSTPEPTPATMTV